ISSTAPGCANSTRRACLTLGLRGARRLWDRCQKARPSMVHFRLLPWEYGVRNLLRRPGRSALTLAGLALVALLVLVVVGFIRGLEASLAVSGDPQVVLIHAHGASENVENSSVAAGTAALLASTLEG